MPGRPTEMAASTRTHSRYRTPLNTPPEPQFQSNSVTPKSKQKISLAVPKAAIDVEDEEDEDAQHQYEAGLSLVPGLGALFLYHIWVGRGFSRLWIPVAATIPLLSSRLATSTLRYWFATMGLLFIYTMATQTLCWFTNTANFQPKFCSSVQHSSNNIPHLNTHSLFQELVDTSMHSTDITSQASEYDLAFQKIATVARLERFIAILPSSNPLVLLKGVGYKLKDQYNFDQAHESLIHLSVETSLKVMQLPQAYVTALNEAVHYTNDILGLLTDSPSPDLRTWQEKAYGTYYPDRVNKIKLSYRTYYTNMRRTIESLLETHRKLHKELDLVATHIKIIYDAANVKDALGKYLSTQERWQTTWRRHLPVPGPYGDGAAVEEAIDYFKALNETFSKTFDTVKRAETELSCVVSRISVYEADLNGTTDASVSVLEVQRLERNIRQMGSLVKVALELRDRFVIDVGRPEEEWRLEEER